MMTSWLLVASLAVAVETAETAADVVVLNDGRIALGQVVDPGRTGERVFLVRRAWARVQVPEWADRWHAAETVAIRRAVQERRDRLAAWRRERVPPDEGPDLITPWIDREILRLADPRNWTRPPLMAVWLRRSDVRSVVTRPPEEGRLLRLAWLAGLADPEEMPVDELVAALRARGVRLEVPDPAVVESLLPLLPETEPQWQTRRAATEVLYDPGLRLIQAGQWLTPNGSAAVADDPAPTPDRPGQLILPERAPVEPGREVPDALTVLDNPAAREVFAAINGLVPEDSREALFRAVAARGEAGLVLTRLAFSADFSAVDVEAAFWVRVGPGRWVPAVGRRIDARAAPGDEAVAVDAGSTVQMMIAVLETVAAQPRSVEGANRTLAAGAAAQRAVDRAHVALDPILLRLALPIVPPAAAVAGRR
jgi:hypothetical protein